MSNNLIDPKEPFAYLDDFLGLAKSGAAWLEQTHKEDKDGIYWDYEPQDNVPGGHSIFSGDGGVGLAFLQLWQETGERHYLDVAIAQAEAHARRWTNGTLAPETPQRGLGGLERHPGSEWSYYFGAIGPAIVLLEVGRNSQRQDLVDAGLSILDAAVAAGRHVDGTYWSGETGILFDGGIIVVLAWAYDLFHKEEYRQAVESGALTILSHAIRHDSGLSWQGLNPSLFGSSGSVEWPGFEFGTAGIGYLLTRAYQVTGRQNLLDAAVQAEQYLQSISVTVGDGRLIPYRTDRPDLFYLGNCHGPSGTSRFAQILFEATGDERYEQWRDDLYRGLVATGAPQTHSGGYWNTSTLCCGTAAITHFGIGLWSATKKEEYRRFALGAARQLAGEAFVEEEHAQWPDAFVRVEPTYVSARTSYLAGTSGIVAVLVEAARLQRGETPGLRLPEDPYPPTWGAR